LGADYFGVVLYSQSPRRAPADSLPKLLAAIPDGQRVAVDVNPIPGKITEFKSQGFDYFQIHYDPALIAQGALAGWKEEAGEGRLWLAPRLPSGAEFPETALDATRTLLLDTYQQGTFGGSGRTGDWPHFRALAMAHPNHNWILSGGLRPENIRTAIRASGAKIVDVNSGVETSPGVKDAVMLDLLFANLADE